MSVVLAVIAIVTGLSMLAYVIWHNHQQTRNARRELAAEERRLRELVHDERWAYNGIYHPDERNIKAVSSKVPRPPR